MSIPTWIKRIREWRKRRFWAGYRERMEEILGPDWKEKMRQLRRMGAEHRIGEDEKLWAEMESFIGKKEDDVEDGASKLVDLLLGPGGRDEEWGSALKGLPPHLRGLRPKPEPLRDKDEMGRK